MQHGYIDFNTLTNFGNSKGRLGFSNTENSLSYSPVAQLTDVLIDIGKDTVKEVANITGTTIAKGKPVRITGSTVIGGIHYATIELASSGYGLGKSDVVGVTVNSIDTAATGFVSRIGDVHNIDLSAFSSGDTVYLSATPGGLSLKASLGTTDIVKKIGTVISNSATTGMLDVNISADSATSAVDRSTSTGIFSFSGAYLQKATASTFNVGPVVGQIVDGNGNITSVTYAGASGITDNYLSSPNTYIFIKNDGSLWQQDTIPTPSDRRSMIYLGFLNHPTGTGAIQVANTVPDIVVNEMSQIRDWISSIHYVNVGIAASPNGANLKLNLSQGYLYCLGLGWKTNGYSDPSRVQIGPMTQLTMQYRTSTDVAYSDTTDMDIGYYDLIGAGRTALAANKFTNQRIFVAPSGAIRVQYGQTYYSTIAQAIAALPNESFVVATPIAANLQLIGIITVGSSVTTLNDTNNAIFTPVSKFGELIPSPSGTTTSTLQQIYNNSTTPEIVTATTQGALTLKRGTAADTDSVLEIANGSGTVTATVTGAGKMTGTSIAITGTYSDSSAAVGTSGQILSSTGSGTQWITPSSGSGSPMKSLETMPIGTLTTTVSGFGASSNNWAFHGVQFTPPHDVTISTSSTMTALLTQTTTGNFMFSIYRLVSGGSHTRVAYTASNALPSAGYITPVPFTVVDVSTLTGGVIYIMGVWYGANSPIFAGVPATTNYNIRPYVGMLLNNQGTVTTPPSSISDASTSEVGRMYFKLIV